MSSFEKRPTYLEGNFYNLSLFDRYEIKSYVKYNDQFGFEKEFGWLNIPFSRIKDLF